MAFLANPISLPMHALRRRNLLATAQPDLGLVSTAF